MDMLCYVNIIVVHVMEKWTNNGSTQTTLTVNKKLIRAKTSAAVKMGVNVWEFQRIFLQINDSTDCMREVSLLIVRLMISLSSS